MNRELYIELLEKENARLHDQLVAGAENHKLLDERAREALRRAQKYLPGQAGADKDAQYFADTIDLLGEIAWQGGVQ